VAFYDAEIKAILKHANPNLTLFILMYLTMAMRRTEIMFLKWESVDFASRAVYLSAEDTKTKKERVIPISSTVLEILKSKRQTSMGLYVFPHRDKKKSHMDRGALKGSWKRAKLKAMAELVDQAETPDERKKIIERMKRATPHDMRRTWKSRAHLRTDLTDTQKEKFAGSSIKVQKQDYVIMEADQLRSLADVVKVSGLKSVLNQKDITWGKTGVKRGKSK
jgi:integrase